MKRLPKPDLKLLMKNKKHWLLWAPPLPVAADGWS